MNHQPPKSHPILQKKKIYIYYIYTYMDITQIYTHLYDIYQITSRSLTHQLLLSSDVERISHHFPAPKSSFAGHHFFHINHRNGTPVTDT